MSTNTDAEFVPVPIPNSESAVSGIRITAATGCDRVGKIKIKPREGAVTEHLWQATYIGDQKWKVTCDNPIGQGAVDGILGGWLSVNGRGTGGVVLPPLFPEKRVTQNPPEPKSDAPTPPRSQRKQRVTSEPAIPASAPQPKKETNPVTPINDPILRKLVIVTCKVMEIKKKQLRDTSFREASGARQIVCNLGSLLYGKLN